MSDEYSIYGSGLKESTAPVNSSYSSNVGQVTHNQEEIERRKKAAAEDVNPVRVGETAHQVTESMGKVEPPLGEAITGTGKNLAENLSPYVIPAGITYGLYKMWQNYSGGKSEGGQPEPVKTVPETPQASASAVPSAPAAIPAAPTGVPAPAPQVSVAGQQQPQMQYGQTNINAPTGVPSPVASAAPIEAAIEPKPVDPIQQAKLEAIAAEQRRKDAAEARAAEAHANEQRRRDEAHQTRLANDAKRAEASTQKKQAIPKSNIPPKDQAIIADNLETKARADLIEKGLPKPPTASPVGGTSLPVGGTAGLPEGEPPAPKNSVSPPADKSKMKWPGGAEGSALQQFFGATKKTLSPEHVAGLELFKEHVGGPLTMPANGGSIHQIKEANSFVEKYSGSPLPRGEDGKLGRLSEEQIQKIHSGIHTELEDAVKNGKLSSLGKGAMAAAALLGLSGAVEAAQKGNFGPLRQAGFDIGGPVALGKLGIAALSRAAGTGFSAATYSGNLNEGEQEELAKRRHDYMNKESQKLGSPYRSVPPPR